MRIEVTQQDVDEGVPFEGRSCALGRALVRALGPQAFVGADELRVGAMRLPMPDEVYAFRRAFDRTASKHLPRPAPISFEIPPVEEWTATWVEVYADPV